MNAMEIKVDMTIIVTMMSDPYLHDPLDRQHTEYLHDRRESEQPVPTRIEPHNIHVAGVHDGYVKCEKDRQPAQQPRRPARAQRQRLQVFHNAEAFANRVRDLLE